METFTLVKAEDNVHLLLHTIITFHVPSLVAQMVKCLPAMWETQVWSLGQEDSLEKAIATHSSTLSWKIPWTEEPGRLQAMGLQRVRHDWVNSLTFYGGKKDF